MDLYQLVMVIGAVYGAVIKLERRLTRIEAKLDRCPHVHMEEKPAVVRATAGS